jgi:class 3 adenylate cyclase/tetratricopeptide (TPR) repeat protein
MDGSRRERKVVTVLFADLVGFTSRAETLDPEDVEAILRPYHERLRSELERYGGTVEKFIGDAVMAVFGAPVAHEDDPERAVRAAFAIRDAIAEEAELEVRIGINTGEALVTLDARPGAGEGMVAGDVVNTAARLQAAAPPNGILVGETTYRATRSVIDCHERDPVEAKGKAEPLPVWEALQARSRLDVDVRVARAPLVGRARELDLLVAALARVREEHSPQLVTLVGEPGIGKSRLVYELFRAVEADAELIWWRHGRSLPYGEGVSFWALGEIVKAQAGILETDSPKAAEEKLRTAVAGVEDAEWVVGHLRPLVGVGGEADLGADRRGEAFAAWRRFFEALAEERPLVLVFEDLHWADDGLLDFVDHLVDWASGVPILVVGSARPELLERRAGWGGGKRNATTISLSPLRDEETARLVGALLDRSVLPAETQARLLQRAGGNPLYAEEFARMLGDRAVAEEVPETIQGVIAARLDGLPGEEKTLLQHSAVVGKTFWLGALEAMDGAARRELEVRLHALERKEFVRRERRSSVEGDAEHSFLHVLVRDVAYGQIPRSERGELHERAARWIEALARREDAAEMLAHHYLQALEYARASGRDATEIEEPTRRALAGAGDRAFALHSYAAALRYYAKALELWPPDDPERNRLLVQNAHAVFLIDRFNIAVLERLRAELEAAGDATAAGEVAALVSWAAWTRGEHERALGTLRAALAELESAPVSRSKAVLLHELARISTIAGEGDGLAAARNALAAAREAGVRDLEARSLNTLGMARVSAGDPNGLDDIERSLALALEIPAPLDITRAYINLASSFFSLGELERSFELHRAGTEAAERWGLEPPARWFRGERSEYDYHAGRWDEAMRRAREFIAEVEGGSPHYLEAPVRSRRSLLRLARGDVSGALEDDARQLELARSIGDPQAMLPGLAISAFVRLEAGERDGAAQRLSEMLAVWRKDPHGAYLSPSELAFAAVGLGRADELLAAAEAARPTRWLEAACAFARGEHLLAADLYRAIGSLPNEAYARLKAGGAADLQRALEFYRSVGAVHYIRQAEANLSATA